MTDRAAPRFPVGSIAVVVLCAVPALRYWIVVLLGNHLVNQLILDHAFFRVIFRGPTFLLLMPVLVVIGATALFPLRGRISRRLWIALAALLSLNVLWLAHLVLQFIGIGRIGR